ncbi:glycogen debranching enzyme [Opitutaceae bacterium TAV5]|nr:glycogen debranching enzyme [Opitutaceae bacterium TAV5]
MNYSPIINHFHRVGPGLFREASGCLRHPFIVPGAQYGAELWDWDAYWTTLGLLELARATGDTALRDEAIRHGEGSLLNFFEHQAPSGAIPIMMRADNPDVFGCTKKQGPERNQAKPVFGQFVLALEDARHRGAGVPPASGVARASLPVSVASPRTAGVPPAGLGNAGGTPAEHGLEARATPESWAGCPCHVAGVWQKKPAPLPIIAIPALDRFYAYWESRYRHAGTGLLVWGSDVAIGVDNDPTTYARPHFSSANLLLNCLYHADLEAAATLAERIGENTLATRWRARAAEIAHAIRTHCWDERDAFFYTLDVQCADHRATLIPWAKPGAPLAWPALPIRIQMFTGFLPLWRGIATPAQAELLRRHASNPDTFAAPAGIRSLSRREPMFSLAVSSNPSNWNGPVWILSNYLVWQGLLRYGFTTEADELASRTLRLLEADIAAHNATHEYYDPDTGRPIMNKGFISWNLLACAMLAKE